MDTEQHERNEERVRRIAGQQGYELHRDRAGVWSFTHQGGWQIVDAERNWLVAGERFDLSLDAVEQWLAEDDRSSNKYRRHRLGVLSILSAGFFAELLDNAEPKEVVRL